MDYNSNRKKLKLPEYGRNIQKMIDYVIEIEDREERNRAAQQIINIMGNMYPYLRDISDFKHKLWDHIAIMSDFKLDIDFPYAPPEPETFKEAPKQVPYNRNRLKYRHYGKIMEKLINEAIKFDDEKPEKKILIELLANHMKKTFLLWNKDSVNDSKIFEDLSELSDGNLKIDESTVLKETRDILKSGKPKTKGGHQSKGHQGKGGYQGQGRKYK
jgi:hypothetical protein